MRDLLCGTFYANHRLNRGASRPVAGSSVSAIAGARTPRPRRNSAWRCDDLLPQRECPAPGTSTDARSTPAVAYRQQHTWSEEPGHAPIASERVPGRRAIPAIRSNRPPRRRPPAPALSPASGDPYRFDVERERQRKVLNRRKAVQQDRRSTMRKRSTTVSQSVLSVMSAVRRPNTRISPESGSAAPVIRLISVSAAGRSSPTIAVLIEDLKGRTGRRAAAAGRDNP